MKFITCLMILLSALTWPISAMPTAASQRTAAELLTWNTFLGASGVTCSAQAIVADGSGNIYVAGASDGSWGTPLVAHHGGSDGFLAKLDAGGHLIWNTFWGTAEDEEFTGIALGNDVRLYVSGNQTGHGATYSTNNEACAICFDDWGTQIWSATFWPGSDAAAIALHAEGVYVAGSSYPTVWGQPRDPFVGLFDSFVTKLDLNGHYLWHTFHSSPPDNHSSYAEQLYALSVDDSGNVYTAGSVESGSTGGAIPKSDNRNRHPLGVLNEFFKIFTNKIDAEGHLVWQTILGSDQSSHHARSLTLDHSGNPIISGISGAMWGNPINDFSGGAPGFLAKLDGGSGQLMWNTFFGAANSICKPNALGQTPSGDIFVTGESYGVWGLPVNIAGGTSVVFVAAYHGNGLLAWSTFFGAKSANALATGLTIDSAGRLSIAGSSSASWGQPILPFAGMNDGFAARLDRVGNVSPVTLTVQRKLERSWMIIRSYGEIKFTLDANQSHNAARLVLERCSAGRDPQIVHEFSVSASGAYSFQDCFLSNDEPVSYHVLAYDSSGALIGISNLVTI
jgi:hypothetical protein